MLNKNIGKSNSTIYKNHTLSRSSGGYLTNAKLVRQSNIHQGNSPCQQNEGKNVIIIIDLGKALDKI